MPPTTTKIVPLYPGLRLRRCDSDITRIVTRRDYHLDKGEKRWKVSTNLRYADLFIGSLENYRTLASGDVIVDATDDD